MTPFLSRLFAAAALLAPPAGLSAHRPWLLPSATVFSGTDNWVTVDSAVSNDLFFADHQPGRLEAIKVWRPDGTPGRIENGATGHFRSVFDVLLDQPGTWKIGSEQSSVTGSFKVDGVEKRVGGRFGPPPGAGNGPPGGGNAPPGGGAPPRGAAREGGPRPEGMGPPDGGPRQPPLTVADIPANATDVKLTEISGRNMIFVTSGAPTATVFQPTGKGLELSPITHPDELIAGEAARFRFLVDGRPAPGVKITIVPGGKRYRDAEGAVEIATGADGVLSYRWPAAGMYWLNATMSDDKPSEPRATARRMSFTTTLEVLAP